MPSTRLAEIEPTRAGQESRPYRIVDCPIYERAGYVRAKITIFRLRQPNSALRNGGDHTVRMELHLPRYYHGGAIRMFTIYSCIAYEHDLRLVVLAALVCAVASFAAINFLNHVRKTTGYMRDVWLCVAATACGFGIWATHFIAMLAYTPGIPSGYNIILTLLSLVAAILLTGAGLSIASETGCLRALDRWATVGGGIAAMHYTGMAAFEIAGRIQWDPVLVVASIVLGRRSALSRCRPVCRRTHEMEGHRRRVLLTLAICSHHFTAMGAVSIIPDPTMAVPKSALPAGWLALGVAIASLRRSCLLACAGLVLDIRDRHRAELEVDRMRGLANASVEGLLVCDGETIVSVKSSFDRTDRLVRRRCGRRNHWRSACPRVRQAQAGREAAQRIEAELRDVDGQFIPTRVDPAARSISPVGRIMPSPSAICVARKKAEQHIHFLAHHDALDGLPNRSSFNARLDQEIEAHQASGRALPCSASTSIASRKSTTCSAMPPATRCCRRLRECVTAVLDGTR